MLAETIYQPSPPQIVFDFDRPNTPNGTDIITKYFKDRIHFDKMRSYLEANPNFLPDFAEEIDLGIRQLNAGVQFDPLITPNAAKISKMLLEKNYTPELPLFTDLLNPHNIPSLVAVRTVNSWMEKGKRDIKTEPYISWDSRIRQRELPTESLIAGRLMDAWGVLAAYAQAPHGVVMSAQEELELKFGAPGRFGGETVMPAVEESLGIALVEQGANTSTALKAIKPWLADRYGFSLPFLAMINTHLDIV